MRVKTLEFVNFRSFKESGLIEFEQINILTGANNSGKSSVLKALYLMQSGAASPFSDVRIGTVGTQSSYIFIEFSDAENSPWGGGIKATAKLMIKVHSADRNSGSLELELDKRSVPPILSTDPHHFIVPYFSKRKTAAYAEDVRDQYARHIGSDFTYLAAKISRLSNSSFPGNAEYIKACKDILGFVVTAVPSSGGQRPGVYLPSRETLFIDQLGEGVANIVALIADLVLSDGKLFLIEEPENDLHPKALKALLELILESSKSNQFIISTHSNIVVRYLASAKASALFNIVASNEVMPPLAQITRVDSSVEARMGVLRELGYTFADFDLWDGWLILEESSAERIIRDYLIPMFAPKLSRIRTLATGGVDSIAPTFEDYKRLVLFAHLEEAYRKATWVRVDGDDAGKAVVERLRARYPTWPPESFSFFKEGQFEKYYPEFFSEKVNATLSITGKQEKRAAKRLLLDEVRNWLDEDGARARVALENSAAEIICELRSMETQLFSPPAAPPTLRD